MTRDEFIAMISETSKLPKAEAGQALKALEEVLSESIASGEKVSLPGLGTFSVTERAERAGRNPRTGEPLTIPAQKTVRFTPAKGLKDKIAG